jgi:hypothetical protein
VGIFLNWTADGSVYGVNTANGETVDAAGIGEEVDTLLRRAISLKEHHKISRLFSRGSSTQPGSACKARNVLDFSKGREV